MTDVLHSTLLYEAATNALAADASGENTWTKMVEYYRSTTTTKENFKKAIKETEDLIKKEYSLTSMPNAWRSAKSVVMGAIDKGIDLSDENGNIKGKTAIQDNLKVAKTPCINDPMKSFRWFEKQFYSWTREDRIKITEHINIMITGF